MVSPDLREKIIAEISTLDDEQMADLLRYIERMRSARLPEDYDEANDPTIGMFSGPSDLARRTKEILRAEFGLRKSPEAPEE